MGESGVCSIEGSVTDELVNFQLQRRTDCDEEISECMIHSSSIDALTYQPKRPSSRLFFKLQGGDQGRVEVHVKTDRQIG
jgi:hypothetical protein